MTGSTEPIGYIFESIAIYDPSSISIFIDKMEPEQAFYVITQAIHMAYSKNIFSMQETEVLSKALRILSQPRKEKTPTE
jgi:hypothetical protein